MTCMGLMSKNGDEADPAVGTKKSSTKLGRKMRSEEQASVWKSIELDGKYAFPRPVDKTTCPNSNTSGF